MKSIHRKCTSSWNVLIRTISTKNSMKQKFEWIFIRGKTVHPVSLHSRAIYIETLRIPKAKTCAIWFWRMFSGLTQQCTVIPLHCIRTVSAVLAEPVVPTIFTVFVGLVCDWERPRVSCWVFHLNEAGSRSRMNLHLNTDTSRSLGRGETQ